jgi:hypothetical protein
MKIFDEIFLHHGPRFAVPECPQIHYITNQDIRGRAGPHPQRGIPITRMISSRRKRRTLYAVMPLKTGGDVFANMYQADNALPEAMRIHPIVRTHGGRPRLQRVVRRRAPLRLVGVPDERARRFVANVNTAGATQWLMALRSRDALESPERLRARESP